MIFRLAGPGPKAALAGVGRIVYGLRESNNVKNFEGLGSKEA